MTHDELKDLCASYVLDSLEPEERHAFEAHLREGCPECAQQVRELREVVAHLASSVPQVAPDPAVKLQLMQRVRRKRASRQWRVPLPLPVWGLAAAAAVVLALLGWQVIRLRQDVSAQRARIASLEEQLEAERQQTRLLAAPDLVILDLAGSEEQPDARARVLWDTGESVWHVYVANLPPLPREQVYQLWFVTADERRSAGVFQTDPEGVASLRVAVPPDLDAIVAAAVSLEPAGGVPQPTGPILLIGTL